MVFVIDWNGADNVSAADDLNLNGANTLSNGYGDTVSVSISTPAVQDAALVAAYGAAATPITQFHLSTAASNIGDADGELITGTVSGAVPTSTTVTVATGMTGTSFEIYDIDQSFTGLGAVGTPWDDLIKIYALDAAGNIMPTAINISNTNGTHTVLNDGTTATISAVGSADPAVNGSGAADSITVSIPGLVYGVVIEYSAGVNNYYSGVVAIGPITFSSAALMCFTRGTMIETETGNVAIEDLVAGDMIRTLDNGFQPLSWVGSTVVEGKGSKAPILFRKGTIGNTEDLLVSPAHRVMIQDWQADLLFGTSELLTSAQSLVNDNTIIRQAVDEVEYFHILFEAHEIVFSNGAPTESFHPGDAGVGTMAQETRAEIFSIFPELEHNTESYGPSVRNTLRPHEAALLNL